MVIIDHNGGHHFCGQLGETPVVVVRFTNRSIALRFLLNPQVAAGEGYTRGEIVLEKGTVRDFWKLIFSNQQVANERTYATWLPFIRMLRTLAAPLYQLNSKLFSKRHDEHHYDIGNEIYESFLGSTMQYSCAYFPESVLPVAGKEGLTRYLENREEDLDGAQLAKVKRIMKKLEIRDGMRVLDIGCGWGGTAIEIAKQFNVTVLGISLSESQLELARKRAFETGVAERVKFEVRDYRDLEGQFDRIVSVGMLEHVGVKYYSGYLDALIQCLTSDGVALLHTIGRMDGPGGTNPWIRKYIFPGGYIPALSEIIRVTETKSLILTDIEVLRLHYGFTLREWHRRLERASEFVRRIMGDEFLRLWEFYLVSSEMAFVYGRFVNYQLQFAKNRFDLSLTRRYMHSST